MKAIRTLWLASLATLCLPVAARAADVVTATAVWARATPPGLDVAAVYLTLHGGASASRLLGASTPRAKTVELHQVETVDGVMQMRPVEALEIPAGKTVVLAPHGLHFMLMGLDAPLVAGQHFPLMLQFAGAPPLTIDVLVRPATAAGAGAPPESH